MASFFQWDHDEYSVSVDEMDDEHQTLIAIMNQLHSRAEEGAERSELEELLGELAIFTTRHFRNEELYMRSIGFPGLESHARIHADLLAKFDDHARAFERTGELGAAFFHFLRNWLAAHIRGIDRKYGQFEEERESA